MTNVAAVKLDSPTNPMVVPKLELSQLADAKVRVPTGPLRFARDLGQR